MAKYNPKALDVIPGMNGLLRDKEGNLYFNHGWNKNKISTPEEFIKGIATIKLHHLDKKYYLANVEFLDLYHKSWFYGDIRGIKGNPWRVNSAGVIKIEKTEKEFNKLYDLIMERLDIESTKEMEKSYHKFLGANNID